MKAYVKRNMAKSSIGRLITDDMRKLEGTIIDVVWDGNCWRTEASLLRWWDDEWLIILPDGYDLAKAVEVNIKWYNTWKELNNNLDDCLILNSAFNGTIAIRDKEIASYNTRINGLMDSIAQRDAILLNLDDSIYNLYNKKPTL